jgi:purine-binding chemotaxis protein CheW
MTETMQYITFGIDGERFALSVERVQEILVLKPISRLPNLPPYVLGLLDVRGIPTVVIDLRTKLGLERVPPTNRTRVIIVEVEIYNHKTPIGLIVDCVFEVTDLGGAALEPAPEMGRWRTDYILGIGWQGSTFTIVLKLDRLLRSMDMLISEPAPAI